MTSDAGAATKPQQERRIEHRFPFEASMEIEWGSTMLSGRVLDISHSGMFLAPSEPLWLGARFAATLLLDPPIKVECTVRRVEPGRGVGVRMVIADENAQSQLSSLLSNLDSRR